MCKDDFVCGEPMIHCCGGYSEHNNCCPHNFHYGPECGSGACGFLLHATHELEEQLGKLKSRLTGDENTIAENYEKCSDAIENISREQQELRNAVEQAIINGGAGSGSGLVNIPTKLSQLTNDLGFVTESRLNTLVTNLINTTGSGSTYNTDGTITQQLKDAINNAGFVTESRVMQLLSQAGINSDGTVSLQLKDAIDNAGFVTQDELLSALQNIQGGSSSSSLVGIKVGDTVYTPSNGVVQLPAYPTSPAYSEVRYAVNSITSAGGALSLAGTTPLHIVNLTGNVSSLTLSSNPADGHSCHVIFSASAQRTVVIAHNATNRICPGASDISLTIPAGGYVEIDFLASDGKVYVRGV